MKRGLITAIAAIVAATVMSTTSFAGLSSTRMTGSILPNDAKMAINLPSNVFTISPYNLTNSQISGTGYIENPLSATDPQSICYDIKIEGYTTSVKSASEENPISLSSTVLTKDDYTADDTSKKVYIALQAAAPISAKVDEATDFKSIETDVIVSTANSTVTLSDKTNFITIKPKQLVPYRVTGTVNPNATWSNNEEITVTPIFKLKPNLTAAIN